jgi:hypothetical protein
MVRAPSRKDAFLGFAARKVSEVTAGKGGVVNGGHL